MKPNSRRCQHDNVRIHRRVERFHLCRECEMRRWVKEGAAKEGINWKAYSRREYGKLPNPCSWPKFCGKTLATDTQVYARCRDCKAAGPIAISPFGAAKAFARAFPRK